MHRMLGAAYAASITLTAAHPLGMTFGTGVLWAASVFGLVMVLTPRRTR